MISDKDVGSLVRDSAGRLGILRAVISDWTDPSRPAFEQSRGQPTAFLGPESGGLEWTVPPSEVERVKTPPGDLGQPGGS